MPPVVGHMIAILLILTLVYYCIKNIRSSSCSGDCSSCSDASASCQKTLPPDRFIGGSRKAWTADGRRYAGKRKRIHQKKFRSDLIPGIANKKPGKQAGLNVRIKMFGINV